MTVLPLPGDRPLLTHAGSTLPVREAPPHIQVRAAQQYRELDLYQRRMLCALATAGGDMSNVDLAAAVGSPIGVVRGRMIRLAELGMAVQLPGWHWKLADAARPHAEADAKASVHVSLVIPQPDLLKQPGDSHHERMIYRVCAQLFAGCHVIPNVPLNKVIDIDAASRFLTDDDIRFGLHPNAHFDVLVLGQTNFLPVLAIEADGDSHDEPQQVTRDMRKNRICHTVGLALVRVRVRRQMSEDVVAHHLGRHLTQLARLARPEHRGHEELAVALSRLGGGADV